MDGEDFDSAEQDSYLFVNKPFGAEDTAVYAENGLLVEFGRELRRERERRGVPVESVCAITKVSARHVEALEAGHLEELPGGVFRKGIVRSYLAAVALEETAWMERFEACLRASGADAEQEQAEWLEFAENVKRNRGAAGPPTGMRWLGVLLMLLALVVCGWLAWRYVLRERLMVTSVEHSLVEYSLVEHSLVEHSLVELG